MSAAAHAVVSRLGAAAARRSGRRLTFLISVALMIAAAGAWELSRDLTHSGLALPRISSPTPVQRSLLTLPAVAQPAISDALGHDDPAYRVHPAPGGFAARSAIQHFRLSFSRAGVTVADGAARLSLALRAIGRGDALRPVAASGPQLQAGRVVYRRGGIREWYGNGPLGLEQGFELSARPAADRAGPLVLEVGLAGNLHARLQRAGLSLSRPGARLRYTDLLVTDARGHPLRASLGLTHGTVLIRIADRRARYPLRIDPLTQQAELTASDGSPAANFGSTLAISGNTAVIGGSGANAAYVFTRPSSGWANATQSAELTPAAGTGVTPTRFGLAVAISGSTILVGAPASLVNSKASGAAYVFTMPPGGWADENQAATLTPSDGIKGDNFGASVAIDGDTIVIGAPTKLFAEQRGAAYVFTMPAGGWTDATQTAELTGGTGLGASVGVSGNTLAAGAPQASTSAGATGEVDVFTMPAGGWTDSSPFAGALYASDAAVGDEFGESVAIQGSTIVAGAPDHTVGSSADQGAAYEYTMPNGGWTTGTETAELTASDGAANDTLGASVALDGDTLVAGAPGHTVGGNAGEGAAYMYTMPGAGWAAGTESAELTPSDGNANDAFGSAVSVSGEAVIAGAPDHAVAGSAGQGSSYVFGSSPPANTSSPVISGTPAVGNTLSCSTGTWSGDPTNFAYQWNRNGQPINQAIGSSYTVQPADASQTLTCTVTASNPAGSTPATSAGVTVTPLPSTVAFTITPDNDPLLTNQQVTFAVTNPVSGVTYQWNFDDGSGGGTGATIVHPFGSAGVYAVNLTATVNGSPTANSTQNVVVVKAQAPTADFSILRSSQQGGTGASTSVTHPVTVVPQATLPQTDSTAQDQITQEDFWLNGSGPPAPPDIICLPDGTCNHVDGETGLGTRALLGDGTPVTGLTCNHRGCVSYSPTAGFESFSVNFWNAALAQIGTSSNKFSSNPAITVGPQEESVQTPFGVESPPETGAYPPLLSVNLGAVDGFQGEQGVPFASCLPGDPYTPQSDATYCGAFVNTWQFGPPLEANNQAAIFGPYDLAHYGINSTQQLEDQWNFLYNYATVVGVDAPLDHQFGPATGATEGETRIGGTIKKGGTIPREITMVAYDADGLASAPVTKSVPLTPASNPSFSVCVKDVTGGTPCVTTPVRGSPPPFAINTGDVLRFELTGSGGGDDPIADYAIAVGQPNTANVKTAVGTGSDCDLPSIAGSWVAPNDPAPPASTETTPSGGGGGSSSGPITSPTAPQSGPHSSADIARPGAGGLSISGATVPPFSDVEAGAFPAHDCQGYADRTVDAAAPPGPGPKSGPNVGLHPSLRGALTPQPPPGDSYASQTAASAPIAVHPAPTEANPILITSNPNALDFTLEPQGNYPPKAYTYSTSIAAYTAAGLGAITRIDGFLAVPAIKSGRCETVGSQPLVIEVKPPTHKGAKQIAGVYKTLAFSGNCMTVVGHENSNHKFHDDLYASSVPIDVSGVPIAPQPHDSIVIDVDKDEFYVAPCSISDAQLTGGPHNPCPDTHTGSLFLSLGNGTSAKQGSLPGIAELKDFNTKTAGKWFRPLTSGALPPVGTTPKQHAPVTGCGLYPDSQAWPLAPSAKYDGFVVVTKPCVAFSENGSSRVGYWDELPPGFSDGPKSPRETSQVVLYGSDVPAVSDLATHPYSNVARDHHPKPVIAGTFPTVRAHAAGLPGFPNTPSCPANTNGRSGLSIPSDTDLGPISLPVGTSFCYVKSTGDFIGNVKVDIPGPLPIDSVEVGFEIGHGRLIDAGGDVKGNIPVFPAVFINEFKFDVQTNPTEVAAAITASIADFLDVEGGVIIDSYKSATTPSVDFEGTVSIAGLQFGDFAVDYTPQGIGMHVHIGKDFGPASLNITVKGAMGFSPFAFYLEGNGEACLFICLGVDGLISNQGLAACGSIDLVFVTFSGGFAVMWSGPNSGVHLFTGCDLDQYIPPSLRNIQGAAPDLARPPNGLPPQPRGSPPQTVLAPGGSEQLSLHQPGMCAPQHPHAAGCSSSTVAIQVHSLVSQEAPGSTPLVTLTGPAGDPRVLSTPTTPGYWGMDSSGRMSGGSQPGQTDEAEALVDQNPVPVDDEVTNSQADCAANSATKLATLSPNCPKVTTTTLFVADPGAGDWQLQVDPEGPGVPSPPVVDVSVAPQEPAVTPRELIPSLSVHTVSLTPTPGGFSVKIGKHTFGSKLLAQHHLMLAPSVEIGAKTFTGYTRLALHPTAADLDVPSIDTSRLRAVMLKVPSDFEGQVALLDEGSGCASPACGQVIASGMHHSDIPGGGLPVLFQPAADAGEQHIVAFLSNNAGMPSRMIMLSSFRSPSVPVPAPPTILKVVRHGSTVDVYFKPHNAPIANGVGLALSEGDGVQLQDTFPASQLHAIGALKGIGAAKQASEYMAVVPYVEPTVRIHVTLDSSNLGHLSADSKLRLVAPPLSSVSESRFLASLGRTG